jgi:hypothetical protein
LDDKIVWDLLKIVSFLRVNLFFALAALVFVVAAQFFDLGLGFWEWVYLEKTGNAGF